MNTFKEIEQKAQAKLLEEEKGARAWFGSNWVPVAVGILIGLAIQWVIHRL